MHSAQLIPTVSVVFYPLATKRRERLSYKGLYRMVKKLGVIASVDDIRPHRFRHEFGTSITRKGLDPLYGKELMGIKSDKIYGRYTQGALKQAAAKAYLQAISEDED